MNLFLTIFAGITISALAAFSTTTHIFSKIQTPKSDVSTASTNQPEVLAATDSIENDTVTFNVDAIFNKAIVIKDKITADNIVYTIKAGSGIKVEGEQNPVISNTGIVSLSAGSGITVDGNKITNSGITSLTAGTGISVSGSTITNSGITSLTAGSGISISGSTITNSRAAPDYTLSGWTDGGTSVYLSTVTDSVGIGTTAPTTPLHVVGTSNLAGNVTLGATSADAITVLGSISAGSSIIPSVDLGADLGSTTKRFNNLWVANINSNSSQAFSGQTTFSYAPTDTTLSQASVIINPTTSAASGQLLYLGVAGYQKALIDEDGDIILGYSDATSAPASDYPLNIYGHSGTRVAYIDTSGNALFAGLTADRIVSSTTGGLLTTSISSANAALSISDETGSGLLVFNTSPLFATDIRTPLVIGSTSANGTLTFEGNNTTGNTSTNANLIFKTGDSAGTTAMTILNSGNVGIGTTAPSYKLQVNQAADSNAFRIYGYDDMAAKYGDLYVDASGYTNLYGSDRLYVGALNYTLFTFQGTIIAWLNGTTSMDFFDNKSLNWGNDNDFKILYDETTDDRLEMSDGTNMFLTVKDQGTASDFAFNTDDLFVKSDGTVGIGTTAPIYALDVKAAGTGVIARFNSDNTSGCTVADGGTITCTSDRSLKKNILELNYGLADVMKLSPVAFNWNFDGNDKTKSLGFIAQDVEQIIPGLVTTDATGLRSLNTIGLVPVLAKAIQEQQFKINEIIPSSDSAKITTNDWNIFTALVNSLKIAIDEIKAQLTSITERLTTKDLCVGEKDNETCIKKDQLDDLIKLLPSPTPIPTSTPEPTLTPELSPTPTPLAEPTPTPLRQGFEGQATDAGVATDSPLITP